MEFGLYTPICEHKYFALTRRKRHGDDSAGIVWHRRKFEFWTAGWSTTRNRSPNI